MRIVTTPLTPHTEHDLADEETQPIPAVARPLGRRTWGVSGLLFVAALFSLFAIQQIFNIGPFDVSTAPHFVYQANAFLQGRWDVSLPASVTDVVVIHGKDYIIYPPFPALLLLPFVAIWGLSTSDVLFTAICSALCLSLLYLLFEQMRVNGLTKRASLENAFIAALCYYGSITLWLSLGGKVWFTAHIVAYMMALLSLWLAFRRQYTWAAVALAGAFFSRSTLLAGFPLLLYLAWEDGGRASLLPDFVRSLRRRQPDWRAIPWRRLVGPAATTVVVALLYLAHNELLFGSPLETGYTFNIQQHYPEITQGIFSLHYVPGNIVLNFFSFPRIIMQGPFDRHPVIDMLNGGYGISVFVTTPLFLFLFWRNRTLSWLRAALWITIGLIVLQVLFFNAAGWYQFGARYLFEAYPYAFLLLVLNDVRVDWRFAALGALGVIVNLLGAHQFWTSHLFHI